MPSQEVAGKGESLAELLLLNDDEVVVRTNGFALILPYLGESSLAAAYDYRRGWDRQPAGVVDRVIPTLVCPSASHENPYVQPGFEGFLEPATRGDPQSSLKWTCKSTRELAKGLKKLGHSVSHTTVARLLKGAGYSLQSNRKTIEGKRHPDRNAQFEHIARRIKS